MCAITAKWSIWCSASPEAQNSARSTWPITSGQPFPWLGINDDHHSLSHEGDSNTTAQNKIRDINIWYAEQIASLAQRLDAIPEGEGTMLDHTIIMWGNELARGNNHGRRDCSFLVIGSGGGYLRTGRRFDFEGRQHNDLLVTFANAFGIETDTFGDERYCTGPISELT